MGKGRRQRVLPLWAETRTALVVWLSIRPAVQDRHLFLNASGQAMTRQGFAHLLARHVESAQKVQPSMAGKHITTHVLRHTCAVHILEATGDLRQVSLWLGHVSMQSTEIYLRVNPAKKLEILANYVPPAVQKGAFNGLRRFTLHKERKRGPKAEQRLPSTLPKNTPLRWNSMSQWNVFTDG